MRAVANGKVSAILLPFSGQVDRASAAETVDLGSIPVVSNQRL